MNTREKNQPHCNTNGQKIEDQVFCYRPAYLPRTQKPRMSAFSIVLRCALAAVILAAVIILAARADDTTIPCWVLCKPGDHVNLRMDPSKDSRVVGFLDCGDSFETDGTSRNGWVRVLGIGECECWIYCGYVVTEEPVKVFSNYCVVARNRVACRRWVDGPQIKGRLGWLHTGSEVSVFYIAGEWAVTSRGYIRIEWLEGDPA